MSDRKEGIAYDRIPSLEGSGKHFAARFWSDSNSKIDKITFPWSNIEPDISAELPPVTVELSKPLVQNKELQGEITITCPDGFQLVVLNYVKGGANRSEVDQKVSKKVNPSENTIIHLIKDGQIVALGMLTLHLYSKQDGEIGYEIDGAKLQSVKLPEKNRQTGDEVEPEERIDQAQLWATAVKDKLQKHDNFLFSAEDLKLQVNYDPENNKLLRWFESLFPKNQQGEIINPKDKKVRSLLSDVIEKMYFFLNALQNFEIHTPQENSEEVATKIESHKLSITQLVFLRDIVQNDHDFKLENAPTWMRTVINSPEITSVLIKIKEFLTNTWWLDIDSIDPNDPLTKLAFFASVSQKGIWFANPVRQGDSVTESSEQAPELSMPTSAINPVTGETRPVPNNLLELARMKKGEQS